MNDRIHRYLDGELPAEALAPAELERARELHATLERAAASLRGRAPEGLAARVMAALPEAAPRRSPWRAALEWLWRPRPLRLAFRPAYALAAGCAAAVLGAVLPGSAPAPVPAAEPVVYVHFRLDAGEASEVAVAGTFTGWEPAHRMEPGADGVWSVLIPLRPGVHDYVFVVDGARWIPDPHAPQQVDDSFGGTNSRISLPPPGAAT
jgi:hypothetical protein